VSRIFSTFLLRTANNNVDNVLQVEQSGHLQLKQYINVDIVL